MVDAEWDQAASAERFEIGGNQSLTMQSSGADTRCQHRSAALATAETTPLGGYAGELTNLTGATRPYEKPSDADVRLGNGRLRPR